MASIVNGIKFAFRHPDTDEPLSFGKVYTYDTGTTSDRITYKDEDKTILNTNPVILDAFGQANICLDGKYRLVVADSNNVAIDMIDPISDTTTQLRGLVGDVNGLGTSVLYDAGTSYGQVLLIGDGTSLGKAANYPSLVNPSIDLNELPLQFKLWHGEDLDNAPSSNSLTILQMPNNDGSVVQLAIEKATQKLFIRTFFGDSWGAWDAVAYGTYEDFISGLNGE